MSKAEQFTEDELATLRSLAETFQDKDERDNLRRILGEGVTIKEIVLAYRTQRRMISTLKAIAGFVAIIGAAYAGLKTLGVVPK
jgi:hypothetical protein